MHNFEFCYSRFNIKDIKLSAWNAMCLSLDGQIKLHLTIHLIRFAKHLLLNSITFRYMSQTFCYNVSSEQNQKELLLLPQIRYIYLFIKSKSIQDSIQVAGVPSRIQKQYLTIRIRCSSDISWKISTLHRFECAKCTYTIYSLSND